MAADISIKVGDSDGEIWPVGIDNVASSAPAICFASLEQRLVTLTGMAVGTAEVEVSGTGEGWDDAPFRLQVAITP